MTEIRKKSSFGQGPNKALSNAFFLRRQFDEVYTKWYLSPFSLLKHMNKHKKKNLGLVSRH